MGYTFNNESFDQVLDNLTKAESPEQFAKQYGYSSVKSCMQDLMYHVYGKAWEEAEEDFAKRVIY